MLVRVKSNLNIPSTVVVNVRGIEFKIRVAVEESEFTNFPASSKDPSSDEEEDTLGNSDQEAINARAASNLTGQLLSFYELALAPRFWLEKEFSDKGYSSKLSKSELIGGDLSHAVQEWNCLPTDHKCRTSIKEMCPTVNGPTSDDLDEADRLGFSNCLIESGLNVEDLEKLEDDSDRPVEIYPTNEVDEESNFSLANQRVAGICRKSKKVVHPEVRTRKYKGLTELGYIVNEVGVDDSDSSLSDSDIEHRNFVILNEAIATFEVSKALGLSFECDNDQLIEVFKNLEEGERLRKNPADNDGEIGRAHV